MGVLFTCISGADEAPPRLLAFKFRMLFPLRVLKSLGQCLALAPPPRVRLYDAARSLTSMAIS
jgi:hypothetical protein